jgi:anti-sigma B factor antagonist
MRITTRSSGPVTILELDGRFDANTAAPVKQQLDRASEGGRVIVNLSGVHFVDSAGLSALISALKRCRLIGGDLRLSNLQQPVRIIFELTKLQRAFETFDSEAEALRAFSA